MVIVHTVKELCDMLNSLRVDGRTVGFVPTMGALHYGHISLVKQSCMENQVNVVSIFVNPTQFNDQNDLIKYPRTLECDSVMLEKETSVDVIFAPSVEEIYPEPDTRTFDFGMLDKVMEGKFRPGHFNGVAQVVSRLFELVKPDVAYFGEKDFQQLAIIREMVKQLNLPVKIKGMPIIRDANGLAMSSRNERLSEDERKRAPIIYKTLSASKDWMKQNTVESVINKVIEEINNEPGFEVEYYEIVDGNTLQPINSWTDTDYAVGCIAVFCGDVRLIDNITYFNNNEDFS
ncbi:pantoate--beta-alanine ligase [Dysgonomonas sp. 520]|uniref:pantoate--beta-alanine ligase n=1 Tax=Dysgonomonas sp. 520 TaxID=2302931 RepID=UPI0013D7C7A0|nr:pantoate--beta-alanine ligase [Dysgonomonas sp. 520]NDW09438.1 pantoate--beta-alanine ligase [Dysgonomonas sp. 520]